MMKIDQNLKIEFMKKACFIADNSTCKYKIGALGLFNNKMYKYSTHSDIKSTRYKHMKYYYMKTWNITLPGEIYCREFDKQGNRICIREKENLKGRDYQKVCSSHAEITLISKCAKYGIPTDGMWLFITNSPCIICARALYQAGCSKVIYMAEHTDKDGIKFLKNSKIEIEVLPKTVVFKDT